MKDLLSARTLYAYMSLKMTIWCAAVFGFGMTFNHIPHPYEIRDLPVVQVVFFLIGVMGIINLKYLNWKWSLAVITAMMLVWDYVGFGLFFKNVLHPDWVRAAIDSLFLKYIAWQIIKHKEL